MPHSIRTRIARAAVIAGVGAAAVLGTAGVALAEQNAAATILPGGQACTATQYASYQVRGFGTATGQLPRGGAKFKVLRNGAVVITTPNRENAATLQFLTPTFPGPSNYQLCANNTGTASTSVTLNLKTDSEIR